MTTILKKRHLVAVIFAAILLGALAACKVSSPEGKSLVMRPNFTPSKSFATIDGHEINIETLDNATRRRLYAMEMDLFRARKDALDQAVQDYLLLKEAERRGISVDDLLKHDVTEPSLSEAGKEALQFIDQHRGDLSKLSEQELAKIPELKNNVDLTRPEAREAVERIVSASIKKRHQEEAMKMYVAQLAKQSDLRVFLQPPPVLRQRVAIDRGPRRGAEKPTVEVVEFGSYGDRVTFQMEEDLQAAAKTYTKQLVWGFRHLPKDDTPEVRYAHLYAYCAQQQGRFWDMHDLLIKEWYHLTLPLMKDLAKKARLEEVPLATCMDSTRGLQHTLDLDRLTARELTVGQSPVYFVNGIMITGLDGPERLRETIEAEAKAAYFVAVDRAK